MLFYDASQHKLGKDGDDFTRRNYNLYFWSPWII